MVRAAAASEYLGKIRTNLPSNESPHPVPAATFDEVLVLCSELQAACRCYVVQIDATEEAVKRMQVTNSYYVLSRGLGTTKTSTQQALFHKMSASASHRRNNSRRAGKAKAGKHLPRASSIAKLEKELGKNLAADVFQVLFLALADPEPIGPRFQLLLNSLHWDSQEPVAYLVNALQGDQMWSGRFDTLLSSLTRHASMGALGGAVLLFRMLLEQGHSGDAVKVASRVFHMLLMLGPELQARGIAAPLYAFFLARVFPMAGLTPSDTPDDMARMSTALSLLGLLACANPEAKCCWHERLECMQPLLDERTPLSMILQFRTQGDAGAAKRERARTWRDLIVKAHTETPDCTAASCCMALMAKLDSRYPEYRSLFSLQAAAPAPAPTPASWCSGLLPSTRTTQRAGMRA